MSLVDLYSAVVINQNQKPTTEYDYLTAADGAWRFQEFYLPPDFVRGTDASEQITPPLTGTQLLMNLRDPEENAAPRKIAGLHATHNAAHYEDARNLGVSALRVDMWFDTIPNWGGTAAELHTLANSYNLKVLPLIVDYGRDWDDDQWVAAALAAVPYADLGIIEIGNEAYGEWFWGTLAREPGRYAKMVKRCADAVAPYGIKVIFSVGGTGGSGLDYSTDGGTTWSQDANGGGWINDMLHPTNGVPNLLSIAYGMAIHPYQIRNGDYGSILINGVENRIGALGHANYPLWMTEGGRKAYTDVNYTSSPTMQAEDAKTYVEYLYSQDHHIEAFFWYNQRDWSAFDPNGDNGWGLIDENGVHRPAWDAYRDAIVNTPRQEPAPVGQPDIEWKIEYKVFGLDWQELVAGTTTEAHASGSKVWVDLLADDPVDIGSDLLDARFRLGFRTESIAVNGVWFSNPNPLASQYVSARDADGETAIQNAGSDVSFCFRVLGLVADEGIDFLGNSYRSGVRLSTAGNASSLNGDPNAVWLSKPNPSRFAVENLYFDMRPSRDVPTYGRINRWTNPSAEANLTTLSAQYSGSSIARITTDAAPGAGSACVEVTAGGSNWATGVGNGVYYSVTPGQTVRIGCWFKASTNGTSASQYIDAVMQWYDATSTWAGGVDSASTPFTNGWQWIESVGVVPSNAATVRVDFWAGVSAGNIPAGSKYLIDGMTVTIESIDQGPLVTSFDGSTPGYAWLGTAHNSESAKVIEPEPEDQEVVIDSILVDPITPNVYFNVYYSSEGDPATSDEEWEWKLWDRVPMTFKATKRESHVLPEPIRAKYIKIEFTHLQADHYAPGPFAKPVKYKKHPKWVLDYFLTRLEAKRALETTLFAGRVAVIYDALDLAYNYYLDDIRQAPNAPYEKDPDYRIVENYLSERTDLSDQLDPTMLEKIHLALDPYQSHISTFARPETLLGQQSAITTGTEFSDYPVEKVSTSASIEDVKELRNAAVVFEQDYPVMFFYLTCRHRYREAVASFQNDRAYFVGIREISFQRERYATAFDTDQYIEPAGDLLNIERNDFAMVDGRMVIE